MLSSHPGHALRLFCIVLFAALVPTLAFAQDPNVTLGKQLVTPAANATVPPGSDVRYRITYACNGVSQPNCGSLSLADTLPAELEIVSCDFPSFTVGSCPVGGNVFSASRALINSGVTGEGFINARVRPSAGPASNVTNTVTASFTNNPGGQPLPVTAVSPPINISAGSQRNYSISKQRVDPVDALVISDQPTFVTDRVNFCATSGVDLVELAGVTLYDDVPAIATNIRTTLPGGSPAISESIAGNRISWVIPPQRLDIDALYPPGSSLSAPSCFSFFVTYDLPAGVTLVQDRAHVRTTDGVYCPAGSLGVPPPGDPGTAGCFAETDGIRGGPQSDASLSKTGNDATPSNTPDDDGLGRINWGLGGSFSSNVGLQNVEMFETLPDDNTGTPARLQLESFTLGNWGDGAPLYDVVADVFITTVVPAPETNCGNASWSQVANDAPANNSTTISAGLPADVTGICWRFQNLAAGTPANEIPRDFTFTTTPRIRQPVPASISPPALPAAITVENCWRFNWDAGGAQTQNLCRTQRIEQPRPGVDPVKVVFAAPAPLRPLDEVVYRVGVNHAVGDSTGAIVNPVIVDVLPPELELLGTTVIQPGSPTPVITTVPNFTFETIPGHTLVRIAYTGSFPRTAAQMPLIELRTRIRAGTADGAYSNRVAVFENGPAPATCAGSAVADVDDLDNDTDTAELRCQRTLGFTIVQAAVLDGTKWVAGPGPFENPTDPIVDDPIEAPVTASASCPVYTTEFAGEPGVGGDATPFTRFPCVARTDFGGSFSYRIRVQNAGNVAFDNYVIYDVLPFIGDTGVGEPQSTVTRNTRFRPRLAGAPTLVAGQTTAPIAGNFVVQYSGSTNPCRPEVSDDETTNGWQGSCTNDWNATPPGGDFANVRALRIFAFTDPNGANGTNWGRLETAVFEIPMQAPTYQQQPASGDALPSVVGNTNVFNPAYGSFAHRAYRAVAATALNPINLLPTAEPVKVGVILPERYRVGNRVWRDINNNGLLDQGEPGIDGVTLRLCLDDDGTAGPSAADNLVGTTSSVTLGGRAGKYRFDQIARDLRYYVAIPGGQAPLTGLQVSTTNNARDPNNNVDNDNNASPTAFAICGGGSGIVSVPNWEVGIPSASEPTNERIFNTSGTDDDPNNGAGTDTWPDRMSNFSADFGFASTTLVEDHGDLPDTGTNTGTGNYQTLLANNGPSHIFVTGLRLGTQWDAELDGLPGATADADDLAGAPDDEDGVIDTTQLQFFRGQPAVVDLRVVNDSGSNARLCAYVDWNADGDFNDTVSGTAEMAPTQVIASGTGAGGSVVTINWGNVPYPGVTIDPTYARFRLSNDTGNCSTGFANGPSASGEVEDYRAAIIAIDRGDLPDGSAGTGTGDYQTLEANSGPSHLIRSTLRFGTNVDHDQLGQPTVNAGGDDTAPGGQPDDEDGITVSDLTMVAGSIATVRFNVTNTSGSAAAVCGFVDFNGNGVLDDAGEVATTTVATGTTNAERTLSFTVPALAARSTYARFRIDADGGGVATCDPDGPRNSGEVEDYVVTINAFDLGDLPDAVANTGAGNYRTRLADGGARHAILPGFPAAPNLFLGAGVDAEPDGAPGTSAGGDDLGGSDDEDGIDVADLSLQVNVPPVINLTVTNQTSPPTAARVCGFIDVNADGDFDEPGESASVAVPASASNLPVQLTFAAPAFGAASSTYARFRVSTDTAGACQPNGDAPDGEVEDYTVSITEPSDLGDLPDLYGTLRASSGARHPLRPNLRLGALIDAENDGLPSVGADGDDLDASDDEDAVVLADLLADNLIAGRSATVRVAATNGAGLTARLCGYIDFNNNGSFADPGEISQLAVPDGSIDTQFSLPFTVPTTAAASGHARFRLSTRSGACAAADAQGVEPDGEVEDYLARFALRDYGDLPDAAAATATGDYRTRDADGGPMHPIIPGLRIGATVDAEGDGQPSASANGDDSNATAATPADDEDGVNVASLIFTAGIAQPVEVTVTNTSGGAARLCGFIDFNRDGQFDGVEIQSQSVPDASTNLTVAVNFTAPLGTAFGEVFSRFRLSTDIAGACDANGAASNGEVEDYVGFVGNIDLGDLPDTGAGTGIGNYNTLRSDNGAQHQIVAGLFMGERVDNEADGQPGIDADGDDAAAPAMPVLDDEDGVQPADLVFIATTPGVVPVRVTNTLAVPTQANLCGYVDFNADGDFLDAGESAVNTVPPGSTGATVQLNFGTVSPTSARRTYARFRLTTASCAPTGAVADGEVEDYAVQVRVFDLGDLPDTAAGTGAANYRTQRADGGARHEIVDGLRLGATVDAEGDGQQGPKALGDDAAGDDEDGVTFMPAYELGSPARVDIRATNTTGSAATVCGFIDWNDDGVFSGPSERAQASISNGAVDLAVTMNFGLVPLSADLTPYARFRISTDAGCAPDGDASNGEVEDYLIGTTGNGALELGNLVWEDRNNNCVVDAGEPGLAGIPVELFIDTNLDGAPDGPAIDNTVTDSTGGYRFVDLVPDDYIVVVQRPDRYVGSTGSGLPFAPTGSCASGVDPDNNVDNDDNGVDVGVETRSPPITLTAENEPGPPNTDTNPTVDFGLLYYFDLALTKRLAPGQNNLVGVGATVNYVIEVINEGLVPARNIQVTDRFPPGFTLSSDTWQLATDRRSATRVIPGPLLPGQRVQLEIALVVSTNPGGALVNWAEITGAEDDIGRPPIDIDSEPDNDQPDEDDQQGVPVSLPPVIVPVGQPWALLLLLLGVFGLALRQSRKILR